MVERSKTGDSKSSTIGPVPGSSPGPCTTAECPSGEGGRLKTAYIGHVRGSSPLSAFTSNGGVAKWSKAVRSERTT